MFLKPLELQLKDTVLEITTHLQQQFHIHVCENLWNVRYIYHSVFVCDIGACECSAKCEWIISLDYGCVCVCCVTYVTLVRQMCAHWMYKVGMYICSAV